jgi:hypothetical protein
MLATGAERDRAVLDEAMELRKRMRRSARWWDRYGLVRDTPCRND